MMARKMANLHGMIRIYLYLFVVFYTQSLMTMHGIREARKVYYAGSGGDIAMGALEILHYDKIKTAEAAEKPYVKL
jgi:hypothetical protein